MLATALLTRSVHTTTHAEHAEFARTQRERLVYALQAAPYIHFNSSPSSSSSFTAAAAGSAATTTTTTTVTTTTTAAAAATGSNVAAAAAHRAGVNALTVDKFEGRYLLSGGADGSLSIWDLESPLRLQSATDDNDDSSYSLTCTPLGTATKADENSHKYGITHVSFYPFDSLAFLSSSYDHTLKIFSSETLKASASFDLSCAIYSHAMSPIASHLLVACASQHPGIRLVDLRSGASTHTLTGHLGAGVFSVAWSPKDQNVLMSGGADGTVRFWDVRRSAGMLASLDKEDSVGGGGRSTTARRAHEGAVNGVMWTDNGRHIVTVGHDERVRVWDTSTGANTLANFGPLVKNTAPAAHLPCLSPSGVMPPNQDVLFYPNEKEILMFDLLEGRLIKRLRVPGAVAATASAAHRGNSPSQRNQRPRITALAWKHHDLEVLSAHTDGLIRSWRPRTTIDAMVDEQERAEAEGRDDSDGRKRKRQILEDIYRELMTPAVTYS